MAPVIPLRPLADGMLIDFFLNATVTLEGRRLQRVEEAHADLLTSFGEQLGDRPEVALRSLPQAAILELIPAYLDDERWHGSDLQDRRVRAQLAWSLAQWVAWRLDLKGSAQVEACRRAVQRSRRAVRRVEAERLDPGYRELLERIRPGALATIDAR